MGMDGLSRPSQIGYIDSFGPHSAVDRAAESARHSPNISQEGEIESVSKDPNQREHGERKQSPKKEPDLGEELQALFSEQFGIEFDPTMTYRFSFNEKTDKFELIDAMTGDILLMLTPEAFLQVMQATKRNAGIITDRTA